MKDKEHHMVRSEKRLSDLRKTRKPLVFDGDDDGEPYEIEVLVCKLNDDDHESCVRAADAAKARMLIDRGNRESETWQSAYGTAMSTIGDDAKSLAEYLSYFHAAERSQVIQAEVAGEEGSEWAKDGYLEGLFDAWRGTEAGDLGLQLVYASKDDDPETLDPKTAAAIPEAIRVFDELARFEDIVAKREEVERERFIREHESDPIEELRAKVIDQFLERRASEVWMKAFQRARVFYCTREPDDYRVRYFKSPAEIADTDPALVNRILLTYESFSAEGLEGKGLPGPQSSSPQSGSSGEEETSEASGPTTANA